MQRRTRLTITIAAALIFAAAGGAFVLPSLNRGAEGPSGLWTDIPELALYAELFNASQSRYRIETEWKEDLALTLREERAQPALAIGRYLKSSTVRDRFQSLDYLFGELLVNQSGFYPDLLALGNVEGRQILLPVSFDLPAIIFAKTGDGKIENDFVLDMKQLAAASAFNQKKGNSYTRMGFSPRWNPNFLVLLANANGASFKEGRPLSWSEQGLSQSIEGIRAWSEAANESTAFEEEFQFKYLYTPAYKYIAEGRARFAYMDSSELFLVPEEKRSLLDYRWFAENGEVPVGEDIVFAAMPRAGKGKQAAEAFLKWLFKEENQKAMIENARRTRSLEGFFGIAGGFSSLRSVNEKVFPLYYPALVGHLPPADGLAEPNVLPGDWPKIKGSIVAPWLLEATGALSNAKIASGQELAARLAEYQKTSGRQ